jgi:hypothetical protein
MNRREAMDSKMQTVLEECKGKKIQLNMGGEEKLAGVLKEIHPGLLVIDISIGAAYAEVRYVVTDHIHWFAVPQRTS